MGGARGRHLFQKVLRRRLLGSRALVRIGMRLALGEVLKRAAGLIRGDDAREVELGDPSVRRPDDLAEVGAVLQGQRGEGVGAVRRALAQVGFAEQVKALSRRAFLVGVREILRHPADRRVHGPVRRPLDAGEACDLAVGYGRNVARIHSFGFCLPQHGGIHGDQSHVIRRGESRSRWLMRQVLLTLSDTHGALWVTVGAHLRGLRVPHITWKEIET